MAFKITLKDLAETDKNISVTLRKRALEKIRRRILADTSITNFAREVGYSRSFSYALLNGDRKSCKLSLVMEISKLLKFNIEDIAEKVTAHCNSKCFIPINKFPIRASSELASLVGHAMGDGHVGPISFHFTNNSNDIINDILKALSRLPIKNITFNERFHKGRNLQFPKLLRDLLIAAGAPPGRKTAQPFTIPLWIKVGNLEIKKSFLRALFDDEASVSVNAREIVLGMKKRVDLINSQLAFFEEIKILLEEIGINGITITNGNSWKSKNGVITEEKRLRITGFVNFIKFKENIVFTDINKTQRLNHLIERSMMFFLKKYKSKIKIIESLKSDGLLTTTKLAETIGRTRRVTGDNLRDLEKLRVVSRIRVKDKTKPHRWFLKDYQTIHEQIPSQPKRKS